MNDAGYGSLEARYYLLDDLMLAASFARTDNDDRWAGGLEYQTPMNGLAFFASVAGGDKDYEHALIGLRFYFGGAKSLKKRHREDDPVNMLFTGMTESFTLVQEAMGAAASSGSSDGSIGGGF